MLGTLTVDSISTSTATLNCAQLFSGQDDVPDNVINEICQLVYRLKRCGSQGTTECLDTFQTCQVVEHSPAIANTFDS